MNDHTKDYVKGLLGLRLTRYDLVRIKDNLRKSMSHFRSDTLAFVDHGNKTGSYGLIVKTKETGAWSYTAWYDEDQLEKITDQKVIDWAIADIQKETPDILHKVNVSKLSRKLYKNRIVLQNGSEYWCK